MVSASVSWAVSCYGKALGVDITTGWYIQLLTYPGIPLRLHLYQNHNHDMILSDTHFWYFELDLSGRQSWMA